MLGPTGLSAQSPEITQPAANSPARQPNTARSSGLFPPAEEDDLQGISVSDKAVTDTQIKHMLLTLQKSFRRDILAVINPIHATVEDLGARVDHLEHKFGDFATSHNEVIDSHNSVADDIAALKAKVADLEDRSRRNNIKLRGVPESVAPADIPAYVRALIQATLPSCSSQELEIDRAHRVPRPRHLDESVPRDILARVHFFSVKEKLMNFSRLNGGLPAPYHHVAIYADLSAATLQLRRALQPITSALRSSKIQYRWGFPVRLMIRHKDATFVIHSLEEGEDLLRRWNISLIPSKGTSKSPIHKVQDEWSTVH